MSSRYLKRLERQRQEELPTPQVESEDESVPVAEPKFNAFALLNEGDDDDDDDDGGDDDDVKEETKPSPAPVKLPQRLQLPNVSTASKKSKKKKLKKKAKPVVVSDSEESSDGEFDRILAEARKQNLTSATATPEPLAAAEDDGSDEFDYEEEYDATDEPVAEYDSNFKYFTTSRVKQLIPILNLLLVKDLDPDHELRNLFGNLSLESIEDANTTTSLLTPPEVLAQFKRLARLTRGWCGKDRRGVPGTTRKLLLSKIRDDWLPTAQKPMQMEEIPKNRVADYYDYKEDTAELEELEYRINREYKMGVRWFRFDKLMTIPERVANTRFYASVVMTPDPDLLMQLLQSHPYHAETLLQVAMVLLRQGGDKSVSYALVERCMFVFDRSFSKHFHELLQAGKTGLIRLPYELFMLRQFYLCLFRNIVALGERLTFATSLAFCKFLLALSPAEDPVGVRYFIDHYAIMAQEYKWLVRFCDLPLVTTYKRWNTPGIAYSVVVAYLKLGEKKLALEALDRAYHAHPYTAICLLQQIGVPDAGAGYNATVEEKVSTETYLVRALAVWEEAEHQEFLRKNLLQLFKYDPPQLQPGAKRLITQSVFDMLGMGSNEDIDNALPYNLIRFAILSGEAKIMAKLPQEVFGRDDVLEYDVLPPELAPEDYDVHTGSIKSRLVDRLLDYVDQGLLGTIIQQRTQDTDFEEMIRNIEGIEVESEHEE